MQVKEFSTGSVKELWRVTFPLMISALSMFAMFFVDRLFLANYSTGALNAAAAAGTLCWAFILLWSTLGVMAEIFVAQYNGAKKYEKIGEPVWQMIWLSVFSVAFFVPMAIWGSAKIYSGAAFANHALMMRWVMYIAPLFVLQSALSAFFIGQGKTSIVRWLAILGNVVNMILDPLFIFGYKGWFPSLGIKGACIATGIGAFIQCAVFAYYFLKKDNRENFGVKNWRFSWIPFYSCMKVGLPPALSTALEVLGWSVFYWMMTRVSDLHILSTSIVQSIVILFIFFGYGLEKGISTVAGNLIGGGKLDRMRTLLKSGAKFIAVFGAVLALFLIAIPDAILSLFMNNPQFLEGGHAGATALDPETVRSSARFGMVIAVVYLVLEDARWLVAGILTAAGDTLFLMIANTLSVWLFMILPTYFFVVVPKGSVELSFMIWAAYGLLAFGLVAFRYWQGRWKEMSLIEDVENREAAKVEAEAEISAEPEES